MMKGRVSIGYEDSNTLVGVEGILDLCHFIKSGKSCTITRLYYRNCGKWKKMNKKVLEC